MELTLLLLGKYLDNHLISDFYFNHAYLCRAGFDSKAALRLARSLLDKAILSKAKNSTASSNSTQDEMTTPTGGKKVRALSPSEEEDDFEGVDVDKDGDVDEDDEDFLKHARLVMTGGIF